VDNWLSLVVICLLGAMSPGPSVVVIMNTALRAGRRTGYGAALAHAAGIGFYALATVTGLAVLIAGSPLLFLGLKLAGALYLIFLGIHALRRSGATVAVQPEDAAPAVRAPSARDGFWIALLNPKVALFMLALFSQFLNADAGLWHKGIMVATVTTTDACWYCLVVTLISREGLRTRLLRRARLIDTVFGILIIALAVSVLLQAALPR
jgi:threonine/homoserine/homoserine lactone efflux protein